MLTMIAIGSSKYALYEKMTEIISIISPKESKKHGKNQELVEELANTLYGEIQDAYDFSNSFKNTGCFEKQPIQLRGTIETIDGAYIDIKPNIRVFLSHDEKIGTLKSGDKIILAGECQKQAGSRIVIRDAVIVK